MNRRRITRTVVLALASCVALFWGAVDIVGVSARQLAAQLVWVSLGVSTIVGVSAAAGWLLSRRRRARQRF